MSINGGTTQTVAGIGITVRNASNVTIRNVDLANLVGGIYLSNVSGTLIVEGVRSRNIGNNTIGSGKSNHIQLAETQVTGFIRNNRFLCGQTEDMVSTWHSGGQSAAAPLVIEDNQLEGAIVDTAVCRRWTRTSGTGIILSDGAGSSKNGNIIVRRNTLLNVGQVSLQIIDGPNLQLYDNFIVAEPYGPNNNPMTTWEGTPRGEAHHNRYDYVKADGSRPSPWKHSGGSGMSFHDNVSDPSLDPASFRVVL